jgi:hypothetical protein
VKFSSPFCCHNWACFSSRVQETIGGVWLIEFDDVVGSSMAVALVLVWKQ